MMDDFLVTFIFLSSHKTAKSMSCRLDYLPNVLSLKINLNSLDAHKYVSSLSLPTVSFLNKTIVFVICTDKFRAFIYLVIVL